MRRTRSSPRYKTPSNIEIEYTMCYIGYSEGEYSPDLVRDIANAYSYYDMGLDIKDSLLDIDDTIPNSSTLTEEELKEALEYNKKVQEFIKNIDYSLFKSDSPLVAAATILYSVNQNKKQKDSGKNKEKEDEKDNKLRQLQQQIQQKKKEEDQQQENKKNKSDQKNNECENPSQGKSGDPQQNESGDPVESFAQEVKEKFLKDSKDENEVAYSTIKHNEIIEKYLPFRKGAIGRLLGENVDANMIRVVDLDEEKLQILNNLSLIGDRGDIEAIATPIKKKLKIMREYSQVTSLQSLIDIKHPLFKAKLATKDLIIAEKQQRRKQTLILLIDDSGSMSDYLKVCWVKTLLYNRLEAVIKNKAELYIITFEAEADINSIKIIKTAKDAEKLIQSGWMPRFNGGGTDIAYSIQQVSQCIKNKRFGAHVIDTIENPQMVVINDGQDAIRDMTKPNYIVHSFILGQDNKDLEKFVKKSGGTYTRFL